MNDWFPLIITRVELVKKLSFSFADHHIPFRKPSMKQVPSVRGPTRLRPCACGVHFPCPLVLPSAIPFLASTTRFQLLKQSPDVASSSILGASCVCERRFDVGLMRSLEYWRPIKARLLRLVWIAIHWHSFLTRRHSVARDLLLVHGARNIGTVRPRAARHCRCRGI